MAVIFSVPQYIGVPAFAYNPGAPDANAFWNLEGYEDNSSLQQYELQGANGPTPPSPTSGNPLQTFVQYPGGLPPGEVVTGYNIQSATIQTGSPNILTNWTTIAGSPFSSNLNIVDINGTIKTWYRCQPVRTIALGSQVYTLDTPWSKPFQCNTPLYDAIFTRAMLPTLRMTYLGDQGVSQTNGTNLLETTGAGNGQWAFDGHTTRFNLQYVMNDDPVKVLDDIMQMVYAPGGNMSEATILDLHTDYEVDVRGGYVTFATPPAAGDYANFEFRKVDFVNDDLLLGLLSGVKSASSYGMNGLNLAQSNNLYTLSGALKSPDVIDILCKMAILRMHEGFTQGIMRSLMAWRDGNASVDPMPSRALEFVVTKLQVTDASLRLDVNQYNRGTTQPIGRGEFDIFWDLTQYSPLTSGMFAQMPGGSYGTIGAGLGVPYFPWYM